MFDFLKELIEVLISMCFLSCVSAISLYTVMFVYYSLVGGVEDEE